MHKKKNFFFAIHIILLSTSYMPTFLSYASACRRHRIYNKRKSLFGFPKKDFLFYVRHNGVLYNIIHFLSVVSIKYSVLLAKNV